MTNSTRMDVDTKFKDLCFDIQNKRVMSGKETIKNKMPLHKVTRVISNMINSNPKIFDSLVEVESGKS